MVKAVWQQASLLNAMLSKGVHTRLQLFFKELWQLRTHFVFVKLYFLFPKTTILLQECLTCTFALMSNSGCKVATPNPCLPISS